MLTTDCDANHWNAVLAPNNAELGPSWARPIWLTNRPTHAWKAQESQWPGNQWEELCLLCCYGMILAVQKKWSLQGFQSCELPCCRKGAEPECPWVAACNCIHTLGPRYLCQCLLDRHLLFIGMMSRVCGLCPLTCLDNLGVSDKLAGDFLSKRSNFNFNLSPIFSLLSLNMTNLWQLLPLGCFPKIPKTSL